MKHISEILNELMKRIENERNIRKNQNVGISENGNK